MAGGERLQKKGKAFFYNIFHGIVLCFVNKAPQFCSVVGLQNMSWPRTESSRFQDCRDLTYFLTLTDEKKNKTKQNANKKDPSPQ